MTFRTDHAAGAAFMLLGLAVLVLGSDLPMGRLSMPGAGFVPKLVAVLTILLGGLIVIGGRASPPFSSLDWSDSRHAWTIVLTTAIGVTLYTVIGFVITMGLLLLALLVVAERRNVVRATVFSLVVVILVFGLFDKLLKAPLPSGPLGF
jgi:hypothetical protein